MEFEMIKEKADVPKIGFTNGRQVTNPATLAMLSWLDTDNETLRFKCADGKEAKNVYQAVYSYKKAHNLSYVIFTRGLEVYLIKA